MISNIRLPKNPYPGFNTKLTGRVAQMKPTNSVKLASTPVEFSDITHNAQSNLSTPIELQQTTEKTAASFPRVSPALRNGFLSTIGALGAAALAHGVATGVESAYNIAQQSKYDKALKEAIALSPALQAHGYPVLKQYMQIIIKSSPTVASEPRLLANYLESMLDAEGHLNMSTFAELTALEGNILKNREMRNSSANNALGVAVKGLTEGAGKGIASELSRAYSARAAQESLF